MKTYLLRLIREQLDVLLLRLARVERGLETIMATQQEITAALTAANEKLKKIGQETSSLLAKVDELQKQVAAAPVTPELQAAVDALVAQAQVVDDLVPDAAQPGP